MVEISQTGTERPAEETLRDTTILEVVGALVIGNQSCAPGGKIHEICCAEEPDSICNLHASRALQRKVHAATANRPRGKKRHNPLPDRAPEIRASGPNEIPRAVTSFCVMFPKLFRYVL